MRLPWGNGFLLQYGVPNRLFENPFASADARNDDVSNCEGLNFTSGGNMPISVSCPGCKANFKAPDQMAGRAASCPKCQTKLQIPALATATALPMATALPSAPAKKPPLPQAQPLNTGPVAPAAVPPPNAPAETPPAKESIWKKRWSIDKIIINVIAIIIFIWFMKSLIPILNRDISPNRPAAGSR